MYENIDHNRYGSLTRNKYPERYIWAALFIVFYYFKYWANRADILTDIRRDRSKRRSNRPLVLLQQLVTGILFRGINHDGRSSGIHSRLTDPLTWDDNISRRCLATGGPPKLSESLIRFHQRYKASYLLQLIQPSGGCG